jgi:hypothetical protein
MSQGSGLLIYIVWFPACIFFLFRVSAVFSSCQIRQRQHDSLPDLALLYQLDYNELCMFVKIAYAILNIALSRVQNILFDLDNI